jgi:hypothetical protein
MEEQFLIGWRNRTYGIQACFRKANGGVPWRRPDIFRPQTRRIQARHPFRTG